MIAGSAALRFCFAELARDAVAMFEHAIQAGCNGPTEQPIDERATGEFVFDAVGEAGARSEAFEFVAMNPSRKGSGDLFVDE
jgi:hypothetical protein